ncbi:MAG: cation:proton antiporter [Bacteroidales bacterium]|nr:cation:proton antiporter [Bacteroidales bacterium]
MANAVIFLGLLIFLGHVFSAIFSRKRVPDVLLLMIIGIVIGPVFGWLLPSDLGVVGSVFASLTLIFILFESGTDISINTLRDAWKNLAKVSLTSFVLSVVLVGVLGHFFMGLEWNASLLLGSILGGTSSAVVIPLVKQLSIKKENEVVLVLESAITDVLCIVFALAFMESYKIGGLQVGSIFGKVIASFLLALMIGVAGGIIWASVLDRIRKIQNSMFLTPAFVFIIYGITEAMDFSGAIAALAFGMVMGNTEYFEFSFLKKFSRDGMMKLEPQEKAFFREIVFVLKTFFFVYIGLSIPFDNMSALLYGLLITLVLFVMRLFLIKFIIGKKTPSYDRTIMSMMIPKGLAAAVLATMPEQLNQQRGMTLIPGAEEIKYVTYSVVFISILFTSILILLMDKFPLLRKFYSLFFGKMTVSSNASDDNAQVTETEETQQTDIFHEVAGFFGKKTDETDVEPDDENVGEPEGEKSSADSADDSVSDNTTTSDENTIQ